MGTAMKMQPDWIRDLQVQSIKRVRIEYWLNGTRHVITNSESTAKITAQTLRQAGCCRVRVLRGKTGKSQGD